MRKTVLLSNIHLRDLGGSEIFTLELADEFSSNGFEVSIITRIFSNPIKKIFQKKRIKVFNILTGNNCGKRFDVIFLFHKMMSNYTITRKIRADYKYFMSLSPFEKEEMPPINSKSYFDYYLSNSKETAEEMKRHGIDNPEVFLNSAPNSMFAICKGKNKRNIEKVGIISNHKVDEVLKLRRVLNNNNIVCNHIGIHGNVHCLVDHNLLSQYDAIITIGKTVPYCMAAGIPVYCYDKFGGPGYITRKNYKKAEFFNYSGRCCRRKLNAQELFNEIILLFKPALNDVPFLHNIACEYYSLSNNLKRFVINRIHNNVSCCYS